MGSLYPLERRRGRRFATTSEALASLVIAKREQSQPATGKVDPDDRTGVTHHLATRTGRRIDAHHARTHLTASFSRCVSRLGSGGRVEPKLQREWPSDPGQMVRHKNLMFPSSQVAPSTCARAVAPAVTTPSRHCSSPATSGAMVGVERRPVYFFRRVGIWVACVSYQSPQPLYGWEGHWG